VAVGAEDFSIFNQQDLAQTASSIIGVLTIFLGGIAAISLLVGGIGIMNIMLANVYDRRKEIGTRRALGARRRDILWQFLFEASVLTSLGGLFGAGIGYLLTGIQFSWWNADGQKAVAQTVITHVTGGWPAVFTTWSAILGVGVSCFVGIVFGLWPARQAARVNPIEALRSE
jgi:putative ABC transport system permease protein